MFVSEMMNDPWYNLHPLTMTSYISLKKETPNEEKHIEKVNMELWEKSMPGIFKLV
jgi:hypothetical protein